MTSNLERYRSQISEDFPDIKIHDIAVIGSGWHHDAVEVNGSIVFRIPRGIHDTDSDTETEIAILKLLKGKLAVQTPDPLYVQRDNDYFGYPKVAGRLLDEIVGTFNDTDWGHLKADWVKLASSIHTAITVEQARELGVNNFIQSGPQWAERIFEIKGVDKSILNFARKVLKQYENLAVDSIPTVFIHNDLQFHNILADPRTKRISGLIDWTDACIGPVTREFAIGEWWTKPGLLEEVAKLYEEQTGVDVQVSHIKMWRNLEEIGDFVENTKLGQAAQARATLERIRQLMKSED